jgi:hypothetical protein
MFIVKQGDFLQIRDESNHMESCARVLTAIPDLIITFDGSLIERFDHHGWNASRTRQIVARFD